jgi:hypothetical protein
MIGGETWDRWYSAVRENLLGSLERQGDMIYWDAGREAGRGAGTLFCTAVYTTILSMPYHYLPLYQR